MFVGDPGTTATIFQNNYKDFAPRVGFAYNVFGNGKTVVRGAYGLFYGFPEGLLYQRTDAMQPVDLYLNIPNPPQWDNVYAGYPGSAIRSRVAMSVLRNSRATRSSRRSPAAC